MQENRDENKQQGGLSWSTPQPVRPAPAQNQAPAQKQFVAPKAPPLTLSTPSSYTTKYAGMIVLGVIVGVTIAWGWSATRSPKEAPSAADINLSADALELGSNFGLTIASPQVAGNSVVVTKAVVSAPTWIVVYEDSNGKPGNALGAGLFFPENQGGTVELLRGTTAGRSYLATEQVDNGDRKFSLKDDEFLTKDGAPQWVTFEVK